jgi:hypothetical protein
MKCITHSCTNELVFLNIHVYFYTPGLRPEKKELTEYAVDVSMRMIKGHIDGNDLMDIDYSLERNNTTELEVYLSVVEVTWDNDTLHRMRTLSDKLLSKKHTGFIDLVGVHECHPYSAYRLKAALLSQHNAGDLIPSDADYDDSI